MIEIVVESDNREMQLAMYPQYINEDAMLYSALTVINNFINKIVEDGGVYPKIEMDISFNNDNDPLELPVGSIRLTNHFKGDGYRFKSMFNDALDIDKDMNPDQYRVELTEGNFTLEPTRYPGYTIDPVDPMFAYDLACKDLAKMGISVIHTKAMPEGSVFMFQRPNKILDQILERDLYWWLYGI